MSSAGSFRGASSPAAMHSAVGPDDEEEADIPRRLMQVKVLYTFDDGNKTNCLARLPHALNIPTVQLDDTAHIGVIELKTCIQAVMQHSPELVGKLDGHDYTVYAYDYSEYETPLVGQGMLSWVLAAASPTPNAPAHESKTMITGRVCKNIMGVFTKGPRETLEVKLKLVPVPTILQKEYVESMDTYRNTSQIIPGEFDPNSWASFLKENSGVAQQPPHESSHPQQVRPPPRRNNSRDVESVHQMLRQNSFTDGPSVFSQGTYSSNQFMSQTSRGPSPTPSYPSTSAFQQGLDSVSRPDSRGSNISERPVRSRLDSFDTTGLSDTQDEGPPKKRARPTQVKGRSKSAFGFHGDSLLQTASAANSVRVHRPTPLGAGQSIQQSVEPPPRVPTPRPGNAPDPLRRRPSNGTSLLRQASFVSSYRDVSEIGTEGFDDDQLGSVASDTPMEFPSSPPVVRYDNDSPPPPSSPQLPTRQCPNDSGFVSDFNVDSEGPVTVVKPSRSHQTCITDETRDPNVPIPREWPRAENWNQHQPWMAVMPGPASALPTTMRYTQNLSRPRQNPFGQKGPLNAPSTQFPVGPPISKPPQRIETYISPYAQPSNQSIPGSDQPSITPKPPATESSSLSESSAEPPNPSFSGENAAEPDAQIPGPSTIQNASTSKPPLTKSTNGRSNSAKGTNRPLRGNVGATRKHILNKHLEDRVKTGETPRYCENCGEIHTSTWRRAYTAVYQGTPSNITLTKDFFEEGGIVGVEVILKEDPTAPSTEYRVYKKRPTQFELDNSHIEMVTLCNPCGLWFDKYGSMRPPERWVDQRPRKPKHLKPPSKPRSRKLQSKDKQPELTSELGQEPPSALHTDNIMSEGIYPGVTGPPAAPAAPVQKRARAASAGPEGADKLQRTQWAGDVAAAALQRAIQSSPARLVGSQLSPIEIDPDLTPKPTRRNLFPSPRKLGEFKSLSESQSPQKSPSPATAYATDGPTTAAPTPSDLDSPDNDKENCPPSNDDDGLGDLFEDNDVLSELLKTPKSQPRNRSGPSTTLNNISPITPSRRARIPLTQLTPKAPASSSNVAALDLSATPSRRIIRSGNARMSDSNNAILTDLRSTPSRKNKNQFEYFTDIALDFTQGGHEDFFPDFTMEDWTNTDNCMSFSSDMNMPSSDMNMPSDGPNYFTLYEDFGGTDSAMTWPMDDTFAEDMQQQDSDGNVGGVQLGEREKELLAAIANVPQSESISSKEGEMLHDFDALLAGIGCDDETVNSNLEAVKEVAAAARDDGIDTQEKEEICRK